MQFRDTVTKLLSLDTVGVKVVRIISKSEIYMQIPGYIFDNQAGGYGLTKSDVCVCAYVCGRSIGRGIGIIIR
jgi:hypothetical protein